MLKWKIAFLAVSIAAIGAPAGADPNTGMVYGYVYEAGTHRGVCGVNVIAEASNQPIEVRRTDKHGYFTFLSLLPAIVRVYVGSGPGESRQVDVHANMHANPVLYVPRGQRKMWERACGQP